MQAQAELYSLLQRFYVSYAATWDDESKYTWFQLIRRAYSMDKQKAISNHTIVREMTEDNTTFAHAVVLYRINKEKFLTSTKVQKFLKKKYPGIDFERCKFRVFREGYRVGPPDQVEQDGQASDPRRETVQSGKHNTVIKTEQQFVMRPSPSPVERFPNNTEEQTKAIEQNSNNPSASNANGHTNGNNEENTNKQPVEQRQECNQEERPELKETTLDPDIERTIAALEAPEEDIYDSDTDRTIAALEAPQTALEQAIKQTVASLEAPGRIQQVTPEPEGNGADVRDEHSNQSIDDDISMLDAQDNTMVQIEKQLDDTCVDSTGNLGHPEFLFPPRAPTAFMKPNISLSREDSVTAGFPTPNPRRFKRNLSATHYDSFEAMFPAKHQRTESLIHVVDPRILTLEEEVALLKARKTLSMKVIERLSQLEKQVEWMNESLENVKDWVVAMQNEGISVPAEVLESLRHGRESL